MPLYITAHLSIPESNITWTAARASGAGGKHVNKTASKILLRFDVASCVFISDAAKQRLLKLAGSRIDAEGRIQIESQSSRSQFANREDARARLAELIRKSLVPPKIRRATKPTKGSKRRRLDSKKKQGDKKKNRQSVKKGEY